MIRKRYVIASNCIRSELVHSKTPSFEVNFYNSYIRQVSQNWNLSFVNFAYAALVLGKSRSGLIKAEWHMWFQKKRIVFQFPRHSSFWEFLKWIFHTLNAIVHAAYSSVKTAWILEWVCTTHAGHQKRTTHAGHQYRMQDTRQNGGTYQSTFFSFSGSLQPTILSALSNRESLGLLFPIYIVFWSITTVFRL